MRSSAPPASSYSLACTRNAFKSICDMSPPPANLRFTRSDAVGSWHASSPARSEESSLLRNHSSSASWIGRIAMPARNGSAPRLTLRMSTRMVWYSAWPLITCPSSWPSTFRTSSSSSSRNVPELITMKGRSMPKAPAFGMDRPFIVINSGTLRLLDDDEVRNVLGHELGHVMSGHALYHTILVLILNVSLGALPFLAGIAILPIQLALLEWFRKSELSSDRAGLLACQDPAASLRVNLKFAGGGDMSQMDLNAFLEQAKEYEEAGGALDRVFKILGVLGRSHPFNTVRAAELQRWIAEGHYERIVGGEYTRRGPEAKGRPIDKDIDEARDHYMKEAKAVVDDVVDTAKRAAQAFAEALRKK